jgi:hypothetical protein
MVQNFPIRQSRNSQGNRSTDKKHNSGWLADEQAESHAERDGRQNVAELEPAQCQSGVGECKHRQDEV